MLHFLLPSDNELVNICEVYNTTRNKAGLQVDRLRAPARAFAFMRNAMHALPPPTQERNATNMFGYAANQGWLKDIRKEEDQKVIQIYPVDFVAF